MRRATALVSGLVLAGLAAATWTAAPAAAGDVTAGSWTQLRATTPAGDSPDLQSTDGHDLPVANTALGPAAIAALRFPSAATTLELTRVDPASALPTSALPALPVPAAVVWACPARGPWQAGDRQPWANRPAYDCARHAVGQATAAGIYWDLTGIADLAVDLVLVPAAGDTTPYQLAFAPPTVASFQTSDAPPPADPAPGPSVGPVSGPPPVTSGTASSPALPVVPGSTSTTDPAPRVALPATQGGAPQQVATRPVAATSAPPWVGAALLAFLALLLMAKAALPAAPTVAPRTLLATRTERESS